MNGPDTNNKFSKEERLSGKISISNLIKKGKFGCIPGFKYCYLKETGNTNNRILVSVPKRFFKRAVKRNLLKRRIRESYRMQKRKVSPENGNDIMFLYNSSEIMNFESIYSSVGRILDIISDAGNEK
jgi:ribonuclease P protein component